MKDWNKICADLSDVSDDDAHDIPNVVSMQKNVHKVVELIRETAAKKAASLSELRRQGLSDQRIATSRM